MFRRTTGFAALALALLPLAACDSGTAAGTGSLQILLTDAPGDFVQAQVTIDEIYLQPDASVQGSGSGLNRVDLMTTPDTANLLSLSNDVATLVENATVPTGTYAQLRFVISNACIEVPDGDSTLIYATSADYDVCGTPDGTLQTPSYDQTGIKVQLADGGLTVTGTQKILLVDFNVEQSFGHEAATGMWVMQPVIRGGDASLTAGVDVNLSLADTVQLPSLNNTQLTLGDFQATLNTEATPVSFTDNGDGTFTAAFLYVNPDAGPFQVDIVGPAGISFTLDPVAPQPVPLTSGQTAAIDFTITSVTVQ